MGALNRSFTRLLNFNDQVPRQRTAREEIQPHKVTRSKENIPGGAPSEAARRDVRLEFGTLDATPEEYHAGRIARS